MKYMQNSKARASKDAIEVLHCTDQARQAIANNNKQQALQEVNQALTADNKLNEVRPNHGFVSMYSELDQYSVLAPIMANRSNYMDPAHGNQSNNERSGSADRSTSGQNIAVKRVFGDFTIVTFDANMARTHLEAAQQALNSGNLQKADQALAALQDSLSVESFGADMPLLRAREDLMLARDSAKDGHYREARSPGIRQPGAEQLRTDGLRSHAGSA